MNKKIVESISLIKEKFESLRLILQEEKDKGLRLNEELIDLKAQNRELSESNLIFSQRVFKLESQLTEAKLALEEQNQEKNRDLEIDFIVKEIDQCINQIKSNL
jgi:hypothetical protein